MIRARFRTSASDFRPVNWPLKHPYWCTGYVTDLTDDPDAQRAIIVAYADSLEELMTNWPDAEEVEADDVTKYEFSKRFPKPEWLRLGKKGATE